MGILDGKVAVITGAGHGVGRGYAVAMAEAGAKVVVNDLGGSTSGEGSDRKAADDVVDVIVKQGGEAAANYANVADFDQAGQMIQQAIDTFGGLDILVCNAGILRDKMIFSMDEADWDAVMNVHMKGHFCPTHHAAKYWREKFKTNGEKPLGGSIITTTSFVGLTGNAGQSNYTAAKGGIAMFTAALAIEMERYGVRANCIGPSGETRLMGGTGRNMGQARDVLEPDQYEEEVPSNPGNVAPLAVWLASDRSSQITGQVFMSVGFTITHFNPWSVNVEVTAPGDKKWDAVALGHALESMAFKTRPSQMQGQVSFRMGR